MQQIDVREGARRQHRTISLFSVLQCWLRGLDGLIIRRRDLKRLIGLDRIKQARVQWMVEDFGEFFAHSFVEWSKEYPDHFLTLIVSRVAFSESAVLGHPNFIDDPEESEFPRPLIEDFKMWEHPNPNQLQDLFEGVIPFFAESANYDERFLTSYLSLLSQGQISPHNLPPLETIPD